MAPRTPTTLSRRRLLAASGGAIAAPVALAACGDADSGDEEPSAAREAELLNAVLAEQLGVAAALGHATGDNAPDEVAAALAELSDLREDSTTQLERSIEDLGGTPAAEPTPLAGGESPTEGVQRQLETSIAASLAAIGELSAEQRGPVHRAITEDAATLAAIRVTLGEEPAPDAFVMGPPAKGAA